MSSNDTKVRLSEMEEGEMDCREMRPVKEKKEKKQEQKKKTLKRRENPLDSCIS